MGKVRLVIPPSSLLIHVTRLLDVDSMLACHILSESLERRWCLLRNPFCGSGSSRLLLRSTPLHKLARCLFNCLFGPIVVINVFTNPELWIR